VHHKRKLKTCRSARNVESFSRPPARDSHPARGELRLTSLRPHPQHPIDHRAGLAEVIRRIAEPRERGAVEVLGDFRVVGEQIERWLNFVKVICSFRAKRYTSRKEYVFNQSSA
jgi:hypothetical protein